MESFLLFKPFSRLPLGSLDSDVRGFPFFSGSRTMNMEKAVFPVDHKKVNRVPAKTQRARRNTSVGQEGGSMLVLGRL